MPYLATIAIFTDISLGATIVLLGKIVFDCFKTQKW
jgi:hypothetical protein